MRHLLRALLLVGLFALPVSAQDVELPGAWFRFHFNEVHLSQIFRNVRSVRKIVLDPQQRPIHER